MPTRLSRHTLTETAELAAALRVARRLFPEATDGDRLRCLVKLGAESLQQRAQDDLREQRRRAQLALVEGGEPSDEQALVLADTLDAQDAS